MNQFIPSPLSSGISLWRLWQYIALAFYSCSNKSQWHIYSLTVMETGDLPTTLWVKDASWALTGSPLLAFPASSGYLYFLLQPSPLLQDHRTLLMVSLAYRYDHSTSQMSPGHPQQPPPTCGFPCCCFSFPHQPRPTNSKRKIPKINNW